MTATVAMNQQPPLRLGLALREGLHRLHERLKHRGLEVVLRLLDEVRVCQQHNLLHARAGIIQQLASLLLALAVEDLPDLVLLDDIVVAPWCSADQDPPLGGQLRIDIRQGVPGTQDVFFPGAASCSVLHLNGLLLLELIELPAAASGTSTIGVIMAIIHLDHRATSALVPLLIMVPLVVALVAATLVLILVIIIGLHLLEPVLNAFSVLKFRSK